MINNEEGDEQLCSIEHYLQTLRKKVQHQLKNPFQIPFANYTFEELLNWKNNILQLDATSRLYGQRVDFLHSGALHILGSVINTEQSVQPQKTSTLASTDQLYDSNPFEMHLEVTKKIDGVTQLDQCNMILWREIVRKRDTLPLLMLNQLVLTSSLRLALAQTASSSHEYEPLLVDDGSLYLKIIDFSLLNPEFLTALQIITNCMQYINTDLLTISSYKKDKPRDSVVFNFQVDFNFQNDFDPYSTANDINGEHKEDELFLAPMNIIAEIEDELMLDSISENSDFSFLSIESEDSKGDYPKRKITKTVRKKKQQQSKFIIFQGINPSRCEVLDLPHDQPKQRFILPKDHLHLRFIKYRRYLPRLRRYIPYINTSQVNHLNPMQSAFNLQSGFNLLQGDAPPQSYDLNQQLQYTSLISMPSFQERVSKFKEAVLPIKQMKRRIRNTIEVGKPIHFQRIKEALCQQQPLDIFITTLHIAAEDGLILTR